jgi:hypothetical protein
MLADCITLRSWMSAYRKSAFFSPDKNINPSCITLLFPDIVHIFNNGILNRFVL